jgi:hypothetical protein
MGSIDGARNVKKTKLSFVFKIEYMMNEICHYCPLSTTKKVDMIRSYLGLVKVTAYIVFGFYESSRASESNLNI